MNKKLLIGIIVIAVVVISATIVIISNFSNKDKKEENIGEEVLNNAESENTTSNDKILVAYFSMAGEVYKVGEVDVGNTAMVATYIKDYLKADSFEIVPENKYPEKYEELLEISQKEQKNNVRPKIKNKIKNFDDYDVIFLGYPIWNDDLPPIIYTFLEEYDFRGKKIIPFNTHEGSWVAGTYEIISLKLLRSEVEKNGLAIEGTKARTEAGKEETIEWLQYLGY